MNKLLRFLTDKSMRTLFWDSKGMYNHLSDEKYLKKIFEARLGHPLDLNNPRTFNEKLQWLKLYDRRPEYTIMVDKYEVKKYVSSIIGEEYIIPTLGVWDNVDDIDFESLPNQFVLKCTHDSGGLVICRDKKSLDVDKAKERLKKYMNRDFYMLWREWPYKNVKHRIIAEKYMEDASGELRDYKIFTFGGVAKALFIATERSSVSAETKFDFYDMDFNHLSFTNGHPNASIHLERPQTLDEMRKIAEILSKNIPHLRVDFYEVNGKAYFGELTFYHWSGLVPFEPEEWDKTFGDWIVLPIKTEAGTC